MNNDENNDYKKSNQLLNEVISPMFGRDFENRVVEKKKEKFDQIENSEPINYLEKQIEEEVEAQTKIAKAKEYEECLKTDTDVLKQYHKQKEDEELKAALPSNYLDFRDSLEKTSDSSSFSDYSEETLDTSEFTSTFDVSEDSSASATSTISELVEDIFDQAKQY